MQGLCSQDRVHVHGRLFTPRCRVIFSRGRSPCLKLEGRGLISLPSRRRASVNEARGRQLALLPAPTEPIETALIALQPLSLQVVRGGDDLALFCGLLREHHYLGYRTSVGENMKYLVHDRVGRVVACLLFGSSAWRAASRDAWLLRQRPETDPFAAALVIHLGPINRQWFVASRRLRLPPDAARRVPGAATCRVLRGSARDTRHVAQARAR